MKKKTNSIAGAKGDRIIRRKQPAYPKGKNK